MEPQQPHARCRRAPMSSRPRGAAQTEARALAVSEERGSVGGAFGGGRYFATSGWDG